MWHKPRLPPLTKFLASGSTRVPKRLRQRRMNEKAAIVFVEEIDLSEANGKRPKGSGNALSLANHLSKRTHYGPK